MAHWAVLTGANNYVEKRGSSVSSLSFNKTEIPNLAVGDLLLVNSIFQNSASTDGVHGAPTGFVRLSPANAAASNATRVEGWFGYPIKTQADLDSLGATLTFTTNKGAGRAALHAMRVTGADLNALGNAVIGAWGIGASPDAPGITTPVDDCLIIGHAGVAVASPNPAATSMVFVPTGPSHKLTSEPATGTASSTAVGGFWLVKATAGAQEAISVDTDTTAANIYTHLTALRPAATNVAPSVNAGTDDVAQPWESFPLSGTASDPEGAVTTVWSVTSGNGSKVTIANPNSLNTTAVVSPTTVAEETFTFQLAATDAGGLTTVDTKNVTVRKASTYGPRGGVDVPIRFVSA